METPAKTENKKTTEISKGNLKFLNFLKLIYRYQIKYKFGSTPS